MPKSRQLTVVGLLALTVGLTGLIGRSEATPPAGVVGTPLVRATFTDDVGVTFKLRYADGLRTFHPRAEDASEVASNGFVFQPGGSTGWHSHSGPVVVLVRTGALTYYSESANGECVGRVYPAGTAFVERGNGHPHMARNESGENVETSVLYFGVPPSGSPRIDEPEPEACAL